MDFATATSANSENSVPTSARNPLLYNPVIRCIYEFLPVKEITKCSLVCKEWNSAAKSVLRNRSKILPWENIKNDSEFDVVSAFKERFVETVDRIPFTAFELFGSKNIVWTVGVLNAFFEQNRDNLLELTLSTVNLSTEGSPKIHDLDSWISNSQFARRNVGRNTKLEIDCEENLRELQQFCFKISLATILNIKDISFGYCEVHLQDNMKIRPEKLYLSNVMFFKDGNRLPQVRVNDFVDLSKARKIVVIRPSWYDAVMPWTDLILDLNVSRELRVDYLSLEYISVVNWQRCNWEVTKLEMFGSLSLLERSEMKFSKLEFQGVAIDFSVLPLTIQSLTVDSLGGPGSVMCTNPIVLPNLTIVSLTLWRNVNCITHFENCPNLVKMSLRLGVGLDSNWRARVPIRLIPKSVKKLVLYKVSLYAENNDSELDLDQVVMTHFSVILSKRIFNPKIRIKNFRFTVDNSDRNQTQEKFLELFCRKCPEGYIQRTLASTFNWENHSFQESVLREYTDEASEYYLFEKDKVIPLSWDEFRRLEIEAFQ